MGIDDPKHFANAVNGEWSCCKRLSDNHSFWYIYIYIYVNKSTTNGTLALLEGDIATNAIHTLFVTELSPKSTTSDGYMDRR